MSFCLSLVPVSRILLVALTRHCEKTTEQISLDDFQIHLLGLVEYVGEMAFAAVLAIVHGSHEDTSATLLGRALATQALDLSITVDLVVLEHSQLCLLALVLDLLRGGVDLLLALLATATQTKDQVKSRLLLDVIVGEGAAVFELLAGEDEALLVGWNALLV